MYEKELESGLSAVKKSMKIISLIQDELTGKDSFSKLDRSPVTIADFVSQAIVCTVLKKGENSIDIVAEEDSSQLRGNEDLVNKIFYFLKKSGLNEIINSKDMLYRGIDFGNGEVSNKFYTLDPIDGTRGFLRGDQYAVALALIEGFEVKLGILGCPNLSRENGGTIYFAIRGNGAYKLISNEKTEIKVSDIKNFSDMRFVQSFEKSHSDSDLQYIIAKELGIKAEPVKVDSQVKYGLLAEGKAEIYLRIPNPRTPNYREKIWDHAAGSVIVEEAGGIVSDILGSKLDFSKGSELDNNKGILSSIPFAYDEVLKVIKSHINETDK